VLGDALGWTFHLNLTRALTMTTTRPAPSALSHSESDSDEPIIKRRRSKRTKAGRPSKETRKRLKM
jgi:hypothetical protein